MNIYLYMYMLKKFLSCFIHFQFNKEKPYNLTMTSSNSHTFFIESGQGFQKSTFYSGILFVMTLAWKNFFFSPKKCMWRPLRAIFSFFFERMVRVYWTYLKKKNSATFCRMIVPFQRYHIWVCLGSFTMVFEWFLSKKMKKKAFFLTLN